MQKDGTNKQSRLLTYEENQQVFKLLGFNCLSLATAVIQLYETEPPNHSTWVRKEAGVLCFVKDNAKKNHFLRFYCLKLCKMIWEQELYVNMEYLAVSSYLHTFEGDECMICFNFANEDEAREIKQIVEEKLQAQRRRQAKKSRAVQEKNNDGMQRNHIETINNTVVTKVSTKDKRRKNLTKADIGVPQEFRHLSHVGWNPTTGFDVDTQDAALTELFAKAGISENHLKDKNTRDFIYDFINKNDHQRIIQDEQVTKARRPPPAVPPQPPSTPAVAGQPGPPVPPRRSAPPPPPSVTQATPQQYNSTPARNNIPPPRPPTTPRIAASNASKASIPPPPPSNAPVPPPPPPMMPDMPISSPPPPPISRGPVDSQPDGRSVLMESIRSGTTLKPVVQEVAEKRASDDARGDLLNEIRKGFQLKPANEREVKPISPAAEQQHNGVNDLAAALSRALAERSRAIHPDDDSDSSDSNDDWDD